MKKQLIRILILFSLLPLILCGKDSVNEISSHGNVISCRYGGLVDKNGDTVVNLVFKNNTGRNLTNVFGSIRIVNREGIVVQRTGFTYARPFQAGEEKDIPAFAYIPLTEEALGILKSASGFVPVVFVLTEVTFEDGSTVNYETQ